MPADPVKIPQNVYIEDRIVGPLTLKQTLIMAISGGLSYAIYSSLLKIYGGSPGIYLTVLAWVPFVLGTAFAVVKINDLSLTRILLLTLEKMQKPASRTFGSRRGITITIRTADEKTVELRNKQILQEEMAQKQARKKISELSELVDNAFVPAQQETIIESPVTATPTAKSVPISAGEISGSSLPVDPSRIKVDDKPTLQVPELTDLSVFRDAIPPQPKPPLS